MTLIVILLIVGVGIAGFFAGSFIFSGRSKSIKKPPTVPVAVQKPAPIPPDLEKRIQALVDSGHRFGAIKELQDFTDLDLEQAKTIIDAMEPSIPSDNNEEKMALVRDLIRSGKKADALDVYRESSGKTLKESEEIIDKIEKEFG